MMQRMRWLDRITNSMDVNLRKLQVTVKDRRAWWAAIHGVTNNQTWLSDWTTIYVIHSLFLDVCELKRGLQKDTFILTLTELDFISKGIFAEVIKQKIWHKVMLNNGKPWIQDKCPYRSKERGDKLEENIHGRRSCEVRNRNGSLAATTQGSPGAINKLEEERRINLRQYISIVLSH